MNLQNDWYLASCTRKNKRHGTTHISVAIWSRNTPPRSISMKINKKTCRCRWRSLLMTCRKTIKKQNNMQKIVKMFSHEIGTIQHENDVLQMSAHKWRASNVRSLRVLQTTPYGNNALWRWRMRLQTAQKIQDLACVPFLCGNHDNEGTAMKKAQVTMQTKFLHFSNIIFASCPEVLFESWQEPNKCFRWPNGCNELLCKYPVIHA